MQAELNQTPYKLQTNSYKTPEKLQTNSYLTPDKLLTNSYIKLLTGGKSIDNETTLYIVKG